MSRVRSPERGLATVHRVTRAAFFTPTERGLEPHPDARSPWADDMLHGRLLGGLAAWAIERDHGDDSFQPARLTVDMFRFPAMAPTSVRTDVVRAGGRVRVVDATIEIDGVAVARASSLHLRRGVAPTGDDAPVTAPWSAPTPQDLIDSGSVGALPPDVPFQLLPLDGAAFGPTGPVPRRGWMRDDRPLVEGAPLTPFVRAALAADFASPLANFTDHGLDYINADLALYLARLPDGEWIGIETNARVVADGVSIAECRFHDERGPVGWGAVCAVLNPPMQPRQQS